MDADARPTAYWLAPDIFDEAVSDDEPPDIEELRQEVMEVQVIDHNCEGALAVVRATPTATEAAGEPMTVLRSTLGNTPDEAIMAAMEEEHRYSVRRVDLAAQVIVAMGGPPMYLHLSWRDSAAGYVVDIPYRGGAGEGTYTVHLERRPAYCDRGRWTAHLDFTGPASVDEKDLWPRYYFDLHRARAEITAWANARADTRRAAGLKPLDAEGGGQ